MLLSPSSPIWALPREEVVKSLQSRPKGLTEVEPARRLAGYEANRLPYLKRRPLVLRLLDRTTGP